MFHSKIIPGHCGNIMSKRVKERYDARQYVAAAFGGEVRSAWPGLLGAWCLVLETLGGGVVKPKGIAKKPLA
jgi:hypothetical protein